MPHERAVEIGLQTDGERAVYYRRGVESIVAVPIDEDGIHGGWDSSRIDTTDWRCAVDE